MQVMRRTFVALSAVAILALVGCGGLGVNIGSGSSRASSLVNLVSIQVQSGPNIPVVSRTGFLRMMAIAYYVFGGQNYVSSTQGATWSVSFSASSASVKPAISGPLPELFNGDCMTPYTAGTVMQNICVFGGGPSAGTGTFKLNATVAGNTGTVVVTVQ
jgi:hypothetical protein